LDKAIELFHWPRAKHVIHTTLSFHLRLFQCKQFLCFFQMMCEKRNWQDLLKCHCIFHSFVKTGQFLCESLQIILVIVKYVIL
jgi:hypothetical protein